MILKGKQVILLDERDSDPEDYFRWFNLAEWQYYDVPDQPFQPVSREQFEARARKNQERHDERARDESRPKPGIHIDTVDGQHLGWVSIYNWDPEEKSTFIGIAIPEEEHWGKGYGTEALNLFISYLFEGFDLDIIRTATWTGNKRMVRCAQKVGFGNEKIMPHRASTSVRGEPLERIEFSLSRAEWKKLNGSTNVEIIRDTIEQIVNQKNIEQWDHYFSPDYIARGAPFIGMGFARDTSGNKHIVHMVFPGSPAEGKLQAGDELLWVEDENRRWVTWDEIEQGLRGRQYKLGVRRGDQTHEYELARDLFRGFDTPSAQAKSEMLAFMTKEYPDLQANIQLIFGDGDMVVCLLEYRGTHAKFRREVVWREAWLARLSEGQIVEGWPVIDESAIYRHLGYQLIPPSS